jgi:molybdopterin biosynthesis enzyme
MSVSVEPRLLSFAEARLAVERYAAKLSPTTPELTNLLDAVSLALAEDLHADRDFPPFPRATRDGYAVHASDVHTAPAKLTCVGTIRLAPPQKKARSRLRRSETAEIMTSAPVLGADAVVMVSTPRTRGQ